jgi:hypothetical protein
MGVAALHMIILVRIICDVPLESVDGSQDEQQGRRPARGK